MTDGLKAEYRAAIIDILAANERVERVVLFGSRAMETFTPASDVDIALFGDRLTLTDQANLAAAIDELPMAQRVDLLLHKTVNNEALRKHIEQHGVEWYRQRTRGEIERECVVLVEKKEEDAKVWQETVYGPVRSDFADNRLADLCDPLTGIQTGPFGSQLHQKDYVSVGTPIITVEHLGENRILHDAVPRVSEQDRSRLSKYALQKGDIVFSRVGSVDRRALVRTEEAGWLFSGRCLRIRPNPRKIDTEFLSYFFGTSSFKNHVRAIAVGATMPSLNTQLLSDIRVPHPTDINEQRTIAHILGTLDDKIECNRRMNATLEDMARTLFKSWFIDFDPVHAKAALDGMNPSIAALFPDRFVDSELGEIPEGWEVKPLPEAIDINPTRSLRKGEAAPYLDMANMPTKGHTPDTVIDRPFGSGTRFTNGDTLVARITPCLENGKTAYVDFLEEGMVGWGSTEYIVMRPKPPLPDEFAYCLARSAGFREFAIQSMTGSSGRQRVPVSALSNYRLPLPSGGKVLEVFGEIVQPFFLLASRNAEQSRTLAALRDTLLPKLISGKVRVGDMERLSKREQE